MAKQEMKYFVKRNICPVCGGKSFDSVYSANYSDLPVKTYLNQFYSKQGGVDHSYLEDAVYSLKTCSQCELTFQEYIPNDYLMVLLYEKWINPEIVRKEQEEMPLWYFETYSKQLVNLITYFNRAPNDLKLLDYGMGWGKWCLMAKAFGCEVFGTELSEARINYAKKFGIEVLKEKQLIDIQFDYINTDQVFEHIPNPRKTLKLLVASLKSGGIIKISVPNGNNITEVLNIMDWSIPKGNPHSVNIVAPLEHINCFRSVTIRKLALDNGLAEVNIPDVRKTIKSNRDRIKKVIRNFRKKNMQSTTLFFKKP